MSDYNLPQEEGVGIIAVWLYEYGLKGVNMNDPGNSPSEIADRWLAEQLRQAWDEGARDAAMSLDHGGHNATNPYRSQE